LQVSAAGTYQVKVVAANGCENTSSVANVTQQAAIPMPVITSTITGAAFCTGGTAVLNSSSTTGNRWFKNGVNNSSDTNKVYATTDSGTYTLKVVLNGCSSPLSAPKTYGLIPKPGAISISGNTVTHINTLETYSVPAISGSSYTWTIVNGSQTSGGTTSSIQVQWGTSGSGTVQVRETASNGCKGDAVSATVSMSVGVNDIELLHSLKVYPNPSTRQFMIEFENTTLSAVDVALVNMLGEVVMSDHTTSGNKTFSRQVSTSGLSKGLYVLEVKCGNEMRKVKLVVN
jgi:hypothetical protein